MQFQFTHPGGVRPHPYHQAGCHRRFNSRTREGCDLHVAYQDNDLTYVSIHAPGRGATRRSVGVTYASPGFNSRTREGCDCKFDNFPTLEEVFQFTHPGGVRPHFDKHKADALAFQFTHPGGVRPMGIDLWFYIGEFQFTHPGGVRRLRANSPASLSVFQFTHPGGVRLQFVPYNNGVGGVSIHAPGRGAT